MGCPFLFSLWGEIPGVASNRNQCEGSLRRSSRSDLIAGRVLKR